MIKERPILFSTEMVKAILDGKKTMTRRVIKPQPVKQRNLWFWKRTAWDDFMGHISDLSPLDKCPFGQAGGSLWVRETWRPDNTFKGGGIPRLGIKFGEAVEWKANNLDQSGKWKPSIFMPRWASRIILEITKIKVERLQKITAEDIIAEGFVGDMSFRELWDSINSKRGYSWASNPWCWCISFKVIDRKL